MKKSLLITPFLAAAGIALSAASASAVVINPVSISDSGCKSRANTSTVPTKGYYDEEPSWSVSYKEGKLTVVWYDYIANCCPEGFDSSISIEGNSIIFNAIDEDGMCDCMCPYDVTSSFDGVVPGHYTLTFQHYSYPVMTAEVDLFEGSEQRINSVESSVGSIDSADIALDVEGDTVKAICEGAFRIDLFSASGIKVYSLSATDSADLSLAGMANGVYYVRLVSPKATLTKSVTL